MKPTREVLQALVESLAKKKMSIKRKAQAPLECSLAIWGKVPRLGAPSPPLTFKGWGSSDQVPVRSRAPPSVVEVSKVAGPETSSRRRAGHRMSGRPYLFVLSLISICPYLCLVPAGGYLCEEPGE